MDNAEFNKLLKETETLKKRCVVQGIVISILLDCFAVFYGLLIFYSL